MKIHYTTRGSPGTTQDWKNIKLGTRVIIYEGWNTGSGKNYYGKIGIVVENRSHMYNFDFCFHVKYEDGKEFSIYPFEIENRVVRGIILK